MDPNSFGSSREKIVSSGSRNLCGGEEGRRGGGEGGEGVDEMFPLINRRMQSAAKKRPWH